MDASAIVPSYNGRQLLEVSLPSISAAVTDGCRGEVIVVDDGSDDGTVDWLAREWPAVRVVALPRNRGYAAAINAGARAASGRHLLMTNNDVEARPGWCRALIGCLNDHPETAVVGGLALAGDDPSLVSSAGIRVARSCSAVDIGLGRPLAEVRPVEEEVTAVSGVSMAVRRSWFLDVGGFDELLGMYYEDVDLCLRAWREGATVRLVPDAVVLHDVGATTGGRDAAIRGYYRARNRLVVAYKTLDSRGLCEAVVLGALHDLARVGSSLAAGDPAAARRSAAAHARGWIAGLRSLPRARRGRQAIRARATSSPAALRRAGRFDRLSRSVREFARIRSGGPSAPRHGTTRP